MRKCCAKNVSGNVCSYYTKVLCTSERGYTPFDAPESISELALRPLIPRLFLLCPFPPRPSLISLFLLMTGVSATGKAIFEVALCEGSGDRKLTSTGAFALAGRPFFAGFSIGNGGSSSRFRDCRPGTSACNSTDTLFGRPLVAFVFFMLAPTLSTMVSSADWAACNFGGRPLRGECTTGSSVATLFEAGADLSFLVGARENWNPPISSSYSAKLQENSELVTNFAYDKLGVVSGQPEYATSRKLTGIPFRCIPRRPPLC